MKRNVDRSWASVVLRLSVSCLIGMFMPGCDRSSIPEQADAPERWTVQEELRVGSEDGPDALLRIGSLIVTANGATILSQPVEQEIWRIDPDGVIQWRAGRSGEGPGEFRALGPLGWKGDSLYAIDMDLQRVSYFDDGGDFIGSEPWVPPALGSGWFPMSPSNIFADGTAATLPAYMANGLSPGQIDAVPLLRVDPAGKVLDTLALLSHGSLQLTLDVGGQNFYTGQPFPHHTLFAFSPSGEDLVVVNREVAAGPSGASFGLTRISHSGETLSSHSIRYTPRPLRDEEVEERIDRLWLSFGGEEASFTRARLARAIFRPGFHTPVTSVLVGTDERIWLRRESLGDGLVRWSIVDEEGRIEAEVDLPANFTLKHASEDRIWGALQGEFDVPYLVRYRLERGAGLSDAIWNGFSKRSPKE